MAFRRTFLMDFQSSNNNDINIVTNQINPIKNVSCICGKMIFTLYYAGFVLFLFLLCDLKTTSDGQLFVCLREKIRRTMSQGC